MNISAPFIIRPVATTLLTLAVLLAGAVAFFLLPVSSLPPVDIPTIQVSAQLPGASPEVMASTVATPLERHLGEIADVTEMTSRSQLNRTNIVLQFGLGRDIDGAARDVESAIEAARVDLPTSLRSNPTYNKFNPNRAPIMTLTLVSQTHTQGQLYDIASNVLQPALSQVNGVGNVNIQGSSLPAVRVEVNPRAMFKYGISLSDVQAALGAVNADSPKGAIEIGDRRFQIYANDVLSNDVYQGAKVYGPLIIASRNGVPVRLQDIAEVTGGVEDIRNAAYDNGQPCVIIQVSQQPGANMIEVVDRVHAILPQLRAALPSQDVELNVQNDYSIVIRNSLRDTGRSLFISVVLVILVVYLFLRNWRAAMVPCVAVPVSLIGSFGAMYLCGFTLDNFSLMALTIATGFVVDDAIVVLENTMRYVEAGVPRLKAAFIGAREVGFTVVSMTISVCAVFVPILLVGGVLGRLAREFVVTLSIALGISLVVSLTTTPMLCGLLLKGHEDDKNSRFKQWLETGFDRIAAGYMRTLDWALKNGPMVMIILFVTIVLNFHFYGVIPKGFLPQQDQGRLQGGGRGDQSASFELMKSKIKQFEEILRTDPAVDNVQITTSSGGTGASVTLKPLAVRKVSTDDVVNRLREKLAKVPGAQLFLTSPNDLRIGGRQSNAALQYTLLSDDVQELRTWAPKLEEALKEIPQIADVNTDQEEHGLETDVMLDRGSISRMGLTVSQVDSAMQNAFSQRQVSTIYNQFNQYHVIMEVDKQFQQSPEQLKDLYVSTFGIINGSQATAPVGGTVSVSSKGAKATTASAAASALSAAQAVRNQSQNAISGGRGTSTGSAVSTAVETMIPFGSLSSLTSGSTPTAVNHQQHFAAATVSFNLADGYSIGQATQAIAAVAAQIGMPSTVHGVFAGDAGAFQSSGGSMLVILLAAIGTVYIVLGILYESYIHPLTIISTLPSAGIGALILLRILNMELGIIGWIGLILLVGIVKKNAIIMIDFAVAARRRGMSQQEAIYEACRLRFRPITMTTMAAILGALPLAVGFGVGAELRQPLGVTILGGLMLSQILTLYTTPVIYLYLARFSEWTTSAKARIGARFRR